MKISPAAFSIKDYTFNKVLVNLYNKTNNDFFVEFSPKGTYDPEKREFTITFDFKAKSSKEKESPNFLEIECKGIFLFSQEISFDEIPPYFYNNGIALLFPFLRAFVSTLTVQLNRPAVIMPTFNLSSLGEELRNNSSLI